jgi:hypothetical protein
MTQTPNTNHPPTLIDAQRALMDQIAGDAEIYAIAHHSKPPIIGALGNKWDEQAAEFARIVASAQIAAAKLDAITDGQASR